MLLLDYFRPPLSSRRHWHAFHNTWATYLATDLNEKLPEGFFAEPNVQFGIEIDVATFEEVAGEEVAGQPLETSWQPPAPTAQIAYTTIEEIVEISILSDAAGPTLKSAIELVSPANKDRPDQRNAFLSKCESLLNEGISLIIVDVVTTRKANFHRELLARIQSQPVESISLSNINGLYAAAYHPVQRDPAITLDIWYEAFNIGDQLPTMPLWLDSAICLPLMLQATYEQTCRSQRITMA